MNAKQRRVAVRRALREIGVRYQRLAERNGISLDEVTFLASDHKPTRRNVRILTLYNSYKSLFHPGRP